jgi:hypothetical protein
LNAILVPNELILLTIAIFSFSGGLLVLIILLSFLRQQRLLTQQPRLIPVAPKPAPPAPKDENRRPSRLPNSRRIAPELPPLPVAERLPIREGTPDQVVIMIEPDKGPTRQERNVRRIIDHLKEMDSSTQG